MAKTPEIDLRDSLVGQNKIINGNFDFWQRGVGPTTSGNYLADRFICAEYLGTGVANMQQSSDVPSYEESKFKSSYSLQMTVTTAQTSITGVESAGFFYKMEGTDFRSLYGKTFTLSFWIKSSVTGTFGVAFRNSGFTRTLVKEVTINAANTWEKKSVTVIHDTTGAWNLDTSMGIDIAWSFSCGATYKGGTDGVWNNTQYLYTPNCNMNIFSTLGNSVKIAQVMLNEGTEALPFSLAGGSYANEFQLCQRYYQRLQTIPAAVQNQITPKIAAGVPLPVEMRTTPIPGQTGALNLQGTDSYNASQTAIGLGSNSSTSRAFFMTEIPNFTSLPGPGYSLWLANPSNNGNVITLDAEL